MSGYEVTVQDNSSYWDYFILCIQLNNSTVFLHWNFQHCGTFERYSHYTRSQHQLYVLCDIISHKFYILTAMPTTNSI